MGQTGLFNHTRLKPKLVDRLDRSLFAIAAILAMASLVACWFGTRAVVNGIVNFEGREFSRQWATAFAHTLSSPSGNKADILRPYIGGSEPERFRSLDNALFDGAIKGYRLYNQHGRIVASSDFQEIGASLNNKAIWEIVRGGEVYGHIVHSQDSSNSPQEFVSHSIAPLTSKGQYVGALEIDVDVSARVHQLNRLRYIAFAALAGLLAFIFGILGIAILRTLDKHRDARAAISQSERQYRQLLEAIPDSIIIHDQTAVLYANDAAARLHGVERGELLLELDPLDLVPDDKREAVKRNREAATFSGEIQRSETLGRKRLDGTIVETDSIGVPIQWNGSDCILVQSRDMTAQRVAQQQIISREAQLTAFMENSQAMMFILDVEGRLILANKRYEEFHNKSLEDIRGKQVQEWAPKKLAEQFVSQDRKVLATGEPNAWEANLPGPDGQTLTIRDEVFPIRGENGQIIGLGGISTDITDIRDREDALRSALATAERLTAELSAFSNHSPMGMHLKDSDLNVTMVNKSFEKFFGVSADTIVGRPVRDWMDKKIADEVETLDLEILRSGEMHSVELELEDEKGDVRNVVSTKFPIFSADGRVIGVGSFNNDITKSRQQEEETRITQARLSAYIDHIPMIVALMDSNSRILMCNYRYEEFFGVTNDDVLSNPRRPWLPEEFRQMVDADNRDILSNGEVIERIVHMQDANGEERILHQVKFPIGLEEGSAATIGVVMSDITDQKQHEKELEDARDDAEAANRAKSAFLANMSHEIRTPMNGMFGMADLLSQTPLNRDQSRYLNTIQRSGEALLGVINNVLDISRIEAGEFRLDRSEFNLHDMIADAVELFAESASAKSLVIAHEISANVPEWVQADQVRLRQVLTNLIGNAIKFTKDGEIVVRVVQIGSEEKSDLIRFEVTDTGIGIPREKQVSLFESFQQADTSITRKYGGTGLGLSIAQHIVGLMGGRIDIDSQENVGSSFVFSLPMSRAHGNAANTGQSTEILAGKRMLIVDDNAINREILVGFGKEWAMEVTAVDGAAAAQAALRDGAQSETRFDVALLDIMMPETDGIVLAAWIQDHPEFAPGCYLGLTSFGWDGDNDKAKAAGFSNFLTKPVRKSELRQAIAQILAAGKILHPDDRETGEVGTDAETIEYPIYEADILIAEDNPVNLELAKEYFSRMGCRVTVAKDGLEAVQNFEANEFDMVLMDVQMPEMDGIQATREIRDIEAKSGSSRVPVIAATAHAFQEDREKCILAGMDDFLSKPYTGEDIQLILGRWLGEPIKTSTQPAIGIPTSEDSHSASPVLDDDTIRNIRSLDASGEDRILSKVVGVFLDTTPPQIKKLQECIASADLTGAALIAHSLKTASANVAAMNLSDLFRELEKAARSNDQKRSTSLAEEIQDHLPSVIAALTELTQTKSASRRSA